MVQKNNFYFDRKGQITVFILIAVLIIILFIFLIFLGNDDKKGNLEDAQNAIILESNLKLDTLKSNIDSCLEREAKKALIVAGLRGGFIYNKGEYYFVGTIPTKTYTQNLISNLGLNWNNLQSRVLVHSQAQVYTPGVNGNVFMYEHSVTSDIEKFVSKNFVDCLNFENSEDIYEINFTDYLGHVRHIDFTNQILEIDSMHANVGDTIDVDVGDFRTLTGQVVSYFPARDSFNVKFDNVSFLGNLSVEELSNLDVVNMNRSLNVTVVVNTEDVSVNLNFPVRIVSNDFKTTYEDSTVKVPIRFKALLELSKELLTHKYLENKSIDYTNSHNIVKVLNQSKYFKSTKLKKLSFGRKILVDEKEHKQYIYSLIDNDSRVLGKPFVFNFGYENIAPVIDFELVDPGLVIDINGNVLTLLSTQNSVISYNLRNYTTEAQFWDDYISYYEPVTYYGVDAEFVLNESGGLYFKPLKEKVYRYNIHVTDGETTREHIIEFITGFPDNTGNIAAEECFSFRNYEDAGRVFPINGNFKNSVFSYEDGGAYTFFGLVNYIPTVPPNAVLPSYAPGDLFFAKSCVFDPSMFNVRIYDQNGNDLVYEDFSPSKFRIPIPNRNIIQKIFVEVTSSSGVVMTEPFVFTVVPSRCLGPSPGDTALGLTCCDFARVDSAVVSAVNSRNVNSINLISPSPLMSGDEIYDEEIYMCFNPEEDDIFNFGGFDYETYRVWDIDPQITSLFRANMRLVCQGSFPRPEHNVEQVGSSGSVTGQVVAIKNAGIRTNLVPVAPLRMQRVRDAGQCEICLINNFTSFGLIANIGSANGLVFKVGEVNGNQGVNDPYVGPIPGPLSAGWDTLEQPEKDEFNNMDMLCDNSWYTTDDLALPWSVTSASVIGQGGASGNNYVSKGYCQQDDSTVCDGKMWTSTFVSAGDSVCSDYFLQFGIDSYNSFLVPAPSSWVCGTYNIFDCTTPPPVISGTGDRNCDGANFNCPLHPAVYSPPCP